MSKLAKLISWKTKKEGRVESFDNQRLFFWYSKSWCRPLATSDHDFYWSNNALQCHAAFYSFVVYFWYMECYFFCCLSCKDCSKGLWCEWLQEGQAAQEFARAQVCRGGRASRVLPCSACPAPSCTLALLYTVLGRQAHQKSLHCFIPALFSWISWASLCNFSVSCRSVRVLTVSLYWQYWCECSECLSCWSDWGRHFPLIFYSGLRGRLLSLNETSKLEKVWPQNLKHKVEGSVMLRNWSYLWPLYLEWGSSSAVQHLAQAVRCGWPG